MLKKQSWGILKYINISLDFSKLAPMQKSHSETFVGNITAVPVNYPLATRRLKIKSAHLPSRQLGVWLGCLFQC